MSLLLDALRRAEDHGRRRQADAAKSAAAQPDDAPFPELAPSVADAPEALSLQPQEPVAPPAEATPETFAASSPELTLEAPPAPPPQPAPIPAPAPTAAPVAQPPAIVPPSAPKVAPPPPARSAQRLLKPNVPQPSRARQYVLLSIAAVAALAIGALFLWPDEEPVRPKTATVPATAPQAQPLPVAAASAAVAAPPAMASSAPAAQGASGTLVAGVESSPPRPEQKTEPAPVPAAPAQPHVRAATARVRPGAAPVAPAPAAPERAPTTAPSRTGAQLQQAYADYQAGRTQAAAQAWGEVLRQDPTQVDAWLGLAVLAHKQGRRDEAIAGYRRVLQLDPGNGEALASLAVLEARNGDPLAESRLREALATRPGDAMVNSALARLLASQGRWDESQPYWFAAHAAAPTEAMHAYNLAVALDRLRKSALAAQYYRKAIALKGAGESTFDAQQAAARASELEAAAR